MIETAGFPKFRSRRGRWRAHRILLVLCAAVQLGVVLPALRSTADAAVRPACTRARVGRTHVGTDGRTQRCVRASESGRTVYRWEVRVTPGTAAPRSAGRSPQGASCLAGGWTHVSALYWENILNAKTLGHASGRFSFDEAVKTLSFVDDGVIVTGYFEFALETSDGTILRGIGEHYAEASLTIGPRALTVGAVRADRLDVTMNVEGTYLPTQRVEVPTLRSGEQIPYSCNGDVLRMSEGGLGGRRIETQYQRYRRTQTP